jgi:hypothetical protein
MIYGERTLVLGLFVALVLSIPVQAEPLPGFITRSDAVHTRHHRRDHVWRHHHTRLHGTKVAARHWHRNRGEYQVASLGGITSNLAAKAAEICSACSSKVISAFRPHARVAGSGRPSLHASGHAVDITGNPACIYAHLHGWRGGYSTDYGAVHHVHISLGGREDGIRFVHGGHASRYASHHRYAQRHRRNYG